jgi:CheY-like chemotaxis protein
VILVVDDDEDNLLLMSYVLEPFHCSVITALDGYAALGAAQTQQPDLILLDIMLCKLDGIQVVSQLKQNPQTMNIPVVAVTALARDEDRERILQAGCDDYVSKPFMIDDLEATVRRHLRRTPSFV